MSLDAPLHRRVGMTMLCCGPFIEAARHQRTAKYLSAQGVPTVPREPAPRVVENSALPSAGSQDSAARRVK